MLAKTKEPCSEEKCKFRCMLRREQGQEGVDIYTGVLAAGAGGGLSMVLCSTDVRLQDAVQLVCRGAGQRCLSL